MVERRKMESAAAAESSRKLYRLIRNTGLRKRTVDEVVKESGGTLIHSQDCRLQHWAEHCREHFGPWQQWPFYLRLQVNTRLLFEAVVVRTIGFLKRHKAEEPSPSFFKIGGEVLTSVNKTPRTNLGNRRDF